MLKTLRLHNFRTYLNAEIELGRRHLIIGKNNSGKTNLCAALRFLGATATADLTQAAATWILGGIPELTNWAHKSSRADFSVTCELPFEEDVLSYQYDLSLEVTHSTGLAVPGSLGLRILTERLVVDGGEFKNACLLDNNGREALLLHEGQVGIQEPPHTARTLAPGDATMLSRLYELETNRRAILFRRFLALCFYFDLVPDAMRSGWRQDAQGPLLHPRGDNLAICIFHLKNQDERRYRRLIERVKPFEETLDAINFLVAPDQGIVPFVSLRRCDRAASWAGVSEGTLRALAISYIIEMADSLSNRPYGGWPPPLIMIEEPENGIYAGLLRKLLEDIENCAPLAQFVFTSHSPYFIDLFDYDPSSVTLLKRDGDRTVVQRLACEKLPPPPDERVTLAEKYFAEALE